MRFIGSKKNIVEKIDHIISKHSTGKEHTFLDLFSGSNAVGNYFANKYQIISNDIMYFSYVLARGSLSNQNPKFLNLKLHGIEDPFKFLNDMDSSKYKSDYVTKEYSPAGPTHRMYFTTENAKKIDFCRTTIEEWYLNKYIDDNEYFYLLSSLLTAIPYVSNTTGTYGAFLKKWDKRSFKPLYLEPPTIKNFHNNISYNKDVFDLLNNKNSFDICYIDPPYNTRQYPSNYHVLEMIAKWSKPALKGVTGQPDLSNEKSEFAVKRKAFSAMDKLLSKIKAKHVIISYSTDGIISEKDLTKLINKYAIKDSLEITKFPYRKYKSKIYNNKNVNELLFYFQPKNQIKYKQESLFKFDNVKNTNTLTPKGYIKSPLNYIGGKYKLLPQIMPLFPENISTFVDLFSGGANVGINVNANKIIFNDINIKINEFFRYLQSHKIDSVLDQIQNYISQFNLSKTNEKGFKAFRDNYNAHPDPVKLYTLVAYSFNYQFRFNNNMQYNNPFGRNRSQFSDRMKKHLIDFSSRLENINSTFTDNYFTNLDLSRLDKNSLVYADPPYLITTGSYNDGNRGFVNWTKKQENQLYDLLDSLNKRHINFALSNVLSHKGIKNDSLIEWSRNYNIHHLNYSYSNASHNTKHLGSDEVIITNY